MCIYSQCAAGCCRCDQVNLHAVCLLCLVPSDTGIMCDVLLLNTDYLFAAGMLSGITHTTSMLGIQCLLLLLQGCCGTSVSVHMFRMLFNFHHEPPLLVPAVHCVSGGSVCVLLLHCTVCFSLACFFPCC